MLEESRIHRNILLNALERLGWNGGGFQERRGEQVTMKRCSTQPLQETTQKDTSLEMGSVREHSYIKRQYEQGTTFNT